MKNLLIIYPHWPPTNLAGVHRPRLIANFLSEFDWHPIILTVDPKYHEEEPDWDLCQTVRPQVEVIKTRAFSPPARLRIIGDIGIRAFPFLWKKANELIKTREISAIWIPVPNYYCMVLGRILYNKHKIPYGIDYIDPWSDGIPGSEQFLSRAWLSNNLANRLEPWALKKAAFITGVDQSYYQYIFDRGWVKESTPNAGMPYGFDPKDHKISTEADVPWERESFTKTLIYAGAYLPKSKYFLEVFLQVLRNLNEDEDILQVVFLGTGHYKGESIKDLAIRNDCGKAVTEIRSRFPYLEILYFLQEADACFLLGSTEPHYTASKTFQMLLSKNPIFGILHRASSATSFLKELDADTYLVEWSESVTDEEFRNAISDQLNGLIKDESWSPDLSALDKYSARESAGVLTKVLNTIADSEHEK